MVRNEILHPRKWPKPSPGHALTFCLQVRLNPLIFLVVLGIGNFLGFRHPSLTIRKRGAETTPTIKAKLQYYKCGAVTTPTILEYMTYFTTTHPRGWVVGPHYKAKGEAAILQWPPPRTIKQWPPAPAIKAKLQYILQISLYDFYNESFWVKVNANLTSCIKGSLKYLIKWMMNDQCIWTVWSMIESWPHSTMEEAETQTVCMGSQEWQ